MDAFGHRLMQNNGFEMHDFIDDTNFDQFIDLIRGGNEDPVPSFGCQLINGHCNDNQLGSFIQEDVFDFNGASSTMVSDLTFVLNSSVSSLYGDINNEGNPEEDNEEDDSAGTTRTTITTSGKKSKVDRTRTLISERRRRGRMKEKLYALRALVPNITKMDKASIIGDAVLYVQELQTQAKKLKAEIAGLEASLAGVENYQQSTANKKKTQVHSSNSQPVCKKIMQMDVFQVEERGFYLKLECNRGADMAILLYRALESLTNFNVQNSNLATLSESYVLTSTLHVRESEQDMHLPNLKLWLTSALLNQGFQIRAPCSA